jgi:aerobic-type carbon monoxide dehydrogenase small subunit (CoxS/CutS family)
MWTITLTINGRTFTLHALSAAPMLELLQYNPIARFIAI